MAAQATSVTFSAVLAGGVLGPGAAGPPDPQAPGAMPPPAKISTFPCECCCVLACESRAMAALVCALKFPFACSPMVPTASMSTCPRVVRLAPAPPAAEPKHMVVPENGTVTL